MKNFEIHDVEYRPRRILFPRHIRKDLAKAVTDAVVGASAVTLLVTCSII